MDYSVKTFQRLELTLPATHEYDNPFSDVFVDAVFTHESGLKITLPAFWDGSAWKLRFAATRPGTWTYAVTASDQNPDLTVTGTVSAEAGTPKNAIEAHGFPGLKEGKRYFAYEDGTPFFYLGDTHWMMFDYENLHECNYPGCTCGNQFKHVADDRIRKGFTVYQTYFASARYNREGQDTAWWTDNTYTRLNPKAFNEIADVMMNYLADNGLVIALGFGTHSATIRSYGDRVDEALAMFVRYAVARYACYPLFWITAQEITNRGLDAYKHWYKVGQLIEDLDGYHHPNGAHQHVHRYETAMSQDLDKQPWHQWWTLQAGHGGYHHLQSRQFYQSYYDNSEKPFAETECHYEDIYCGGFCGHEASRMGAWLAMQSGSAGFTYGVEGLWAMSWDMKTAPGYASYNPEAWWAGVDKPGSEQVCTMKKFYEYVGWYKLTPHFGFDFGNFDMRKNVAISHIGQDVLVYYFFGKEQECGYISGLKPNVKYQARWFDPVDGGFLDLPDVISPDGRMAVPALPSPRDWTLLLNDYDLGPYEKSTYPKCEKPFPADKAEPGEEYPVVSLWASSEDEEFPAKNMIDGDANTCWKGFKPYTSQTLIADLGESRDLGYLYLETPLEKMRYIEYRVYGSNDGKSWQLLVEREGALVAVGGPYPRYFEALSGSWRYVKFFLNSVDLTAPFDTPLPVTKLAFYGKKN